MSDTLNAREQLEAAASWLAHQHEDLSYGLKTPMDALKLWLYAQAHPELAEFCDEATGEDGDWLPRHFKAAIGYNPWTHAAKLAFSD